jgi:hypothetical protein
VWVTIGSGLLFTLVDANHGIGELRKGEHVEDDRRENARIGLRICLMALATMLGSSDIFVAKAVLQ